jgi:uncharacterized delta-60 repeat protein
MATDPAGRTVVAAIGQRCGAYECAHAQLLVARFNPNGGLDPTFAQDGVAAQPMSGSPAFAVSGMAIDSSGRTVVAANGLGSTAGEYPTTTVFRLRRNGDLDANFGDRGMTTVSAQTFYPGFFGQKLAIDGDGRVLIAGAAFATGGIAAMRLLADGAIDSGFGNAGVASLRLDPDDIEESGSAVTPAVGGRIVVGATAQFRGDLHTDAVAVAFTDSGEVDRTFGGGDGVVSFAWLAPLYETTLASVGRILSDSQGRRVMVGSGTSGLIHSCDNYASARLTAAGELDPSYGNAGVAFPRLPLCARPTDALLNSAGRLTVPLVQPSRIFLARQDAAGALDPRFGDGGTAGMRLEKTKRSSVNAIAAAPGGKTLATGYAESNRCMRARGTRHLSSCTALLLTRFTARGELDQSFGSNGFVTWPRVLPRAGVAAHMKR